MKGTKIKKASNAKAKPQKIVSNFPKAGGNRSTGLSRRQKFKLAKKQLANERLQIKGRPNLAKSIGSAVAEGTAPIASSIAASKSVENITAAKRANADRALYEWNRVIGGNPSGEGSEGSTQGKSTTETTSAGTFRSVLD